MTRGRDICEKYLAMVENAYQLFMNLGKAFDKFGTSYKERQFTIDFAMHSKEYCRVDSTVSWSTGQKFINHVWSSLICFMNFSMESLLTAFARTVPLLVDLE